MKFIKYTSLIIALGLISVTNFAIAESNSSKTDNDDFANRFGPYGLNYAIYNVADGDEEAIQAQYSIKFRLFDCEVNNEEEQFDTCRPNSDTKFYVDFTYTGRFDFYWGSRDSDPVINRISNPALHFLWTRSTENRFFDEYDIGLEHRSNGQVEDADAFIGVENTDSFQYLSQIALDSGDHEYFDTISRSSNYVSIAAKQIVDKSMYWKVRFKHYVNQESEVTWGELAGTGVEFEDYDLVNFEFTKSFSIGEQAVTLNTVYVLGNEAFDTDSLDVNLRLPIAWSNDNWKIPLFIRAHFGPMERLSNYTKSTNSIGVGLAFNFD